MNVKIGDMFVSPLSDYSRTVCVVEMFDDNRVAVNNLTTGRRSLIKLSTLSRWTPLHLAAEELANARRKP